MKLSGSGLLKLLQLSGRLLAGFLDGGEPVQHLLRLSFLHGREIQEKLVEGKPALPIIDQCLHWDRCACENRDSAHDIRVGEKYGRIHAARSYLNPAKTQDNSISLAFRQIKLGTLDMMNESPRLPIAALDSSHTSYTFLQRIKPFRRLAGVGIARSLF